MFSFISFRSKHVFFYTLQDFHTNIKDKNYVLHYQVIINQESMIYLVWKSELECQCHPAEKNACLIFWPKMRKTPEAKLPGRKILEAKPGRSPKRKRFESFCKREKVLQNKEWSRKLTVVRGGLTELGQNVRCNFRSKLFFCKRRKERKRNNLQLRVDGLVLS